MDLFVIPSRDMGTHMYRGTLTHRGSVATRTPHSVAVASAGSAGSRTRTTGARGRRGRQAQTKTRARRNAADRAPVGRPARGARVDRRSRDHGRLPPVAPSAAAGASGDQPGRSETRADDGDRRLPPIDEGRIKAVDENHCEERNERGEATSERKPTIDK